MAKIFRSHFSRNVILLFTGLTIIFSIVIVIVPGIYRIRIQEQQVQEQIKLINTKAQSIFLPQAIYKANYIDQLLDAQEKDILILADTAGDLFSGQYNSLETDTLSSSTSIISQLHTLAQENNCTFYSSTTIFEDQAVVERQLKISAITSTMQSIAREDPIIQDIFIRTIDQTEWVCPQTSDASTHYSTYEYVDQYYFPMTLTEWAIQWNVHFVDDVPIITVIAPIWASGKFYGEVGISLRLSIIINQVPQYNLTDSSQLFILNNNGNVMAIPSWVSPSKITPWINEEPSYYLNKPFTELISDTLGRTLITSHFEEKIKATTPIIFPIEKFDETNFFAIAPIGTKSIKVLVVLPLKDVFNTLSFWGENLTTDIVPTLMELGISIIGASLLLAVSAMISIRYFINPIQEVSNTALNIAKGNLSIRLPEKGEGELLNLAKSFNIMIQNVEHSENELVAKKDELTDLITIQKQEFEVIQQIVGVTNQVSKLSKKLLNVINLTIPLAKTPKAAILLIDNGKIYQSVINTNQKGTPYLKEKRLVASAQREELTNLNKYKKDGEIHPVHFSDKTSQDELYGFAFPILERNQIIGIMAYFSSAKMDFSQLRLPFLSVLSNYIAVIIENAELQEKTRDLIITDERRHMANELHDAISQSLFSLVLTEESIHHQLQNNGDVSKPLEFLMDQTQHIQEEMRWLISEFRPLATQRDNLTNSITRQINTMQRLCPGMEVVYEISESTNNLPLEIQNHLNRILQEALSNIIRHANAKNVKINLTIKESSLNLEICDDGIGFELDKLIDGKAESYGIISMLGRTDQIKGTIDIQTAPQEGTKILVQTELSK